MGPASRLLRTGNAAHSQSHPAEHLGTLNDKQRGHCPLTAQHGSWHDTGRTAGKKAGLRNGCCAELQQPPQAASFAARHGLPTSMPSRSPCCFSKVTKRWYTASAWFLGMWSRAYLKMARALSCSLQRSSNSANLMKSSSCRAACWYQDLHAASLPVPRAEEGNQAQHDL